VGEYREKKRATVWKLGVSDLQGNVVCDGGGAFHHLIIAAPSTAGENHTGRYKDMLYVIGVFLLNFHQHLPRTTK